MSLAIPTGGSTLAINALDLKMGFAGKVVGAILASNDARTAGTLTAAVRVAGVVTNLTAAIDATNTQTYAQQAAEGAGVAFTAGQAVGMAVVTSGAWAPTTADVTGWLLIEA
jgi:hypothetical protein